MSTKKTQNPIGQEDMTAYLNFLLSGQAESREHVAQINKVAKHITTVTDVTIIAKLLVGQLSQKLTQVMDVIQIQNRVLQRLGATPELFEEAEAEYNEQLNEMQKELEEQAKAAQEAKEAVPEEILEELEKEVEEHNAD